MKAYDFGKNKLVRLEDITVVTPEKPSDGNLKAPLPSPTIPEEYRVQYPLRKAYEQYEADDASQLPPYGDSCISGECLEQYGLRANLDHTPELTIGKPCSDILTFITGASEVKPQFTIKRLLTYHLDVNIPYTLVLPDGSEYLMDQVLDAIRTLTPLRKHDAGTT